MAEKSPGTGRAAGTGAVVAVIPAAGAGRRMGSARAKQFLEILGRPLLALTLDPFERCGSVDGVVVVVPAEETAYCREKIVARFGFGKVRRVVAGGERRQDSVRLGLEAAGDRWGWVVVHDGVRPLIDVDLLERAIAAGKRLGAVVTALPARDTIKETDDSGRVIRTLSRERKWLIQTPQVFSYDMLRTAHRRAMEEDWPEATDDAVLLERMGIPVSVMQGLEWNVKVTAPGDLDLVRYYLARGLGRGAQSSAEREGGAGWAER